MNTAEPLLDEGWRSMNSAHDRAAYRNTSQEEEIQWPYHDAGSSIFHKSKKQQEKHQYNSSCVKFLLVISINKYSICFGQIPFQVCQVFFCRVLMNAQHYLSLPLSFLHFLSIHKFLSHFKISAATTTSHHVQSTQLPQGSFPLNFPNNASFLLPFSLIPLKPVKFCNRICTNPLIFC